MLILTLFNSEKFRPIVLLSQTCSRKCQDVDQFASAAFSDSRIHRKSPQRLRLDSSQNAVDATLVDNALASVSTLQGQLGAAQNRFQSTIANLQVTTENLSASESRIRDTDMAAEMVNFTKLQILQQAGTAILAQANQAPQTVLSLLR